MTALAAVLIRAERDLASVRKISVAVPPCGADADRLVAFPIFAAVSHRGVEGRLPRWIGIAHDATLATVLDVGLKIYTNATAYVVFAGRNARMIATALVA